jgi:hypothetical protein
MKPIIYIISLFSVLLFTSCHKDTDSDIKSEDITTFSAKVYKEVNGSILGYVYDENNNPVADATVATYSTTTKTNKHGVFLIKNAKMDQQGTYIKVVKNGFLLGSDYVYPSEGTTVSSRIQMLRLNNKYNFLSSQGATLDLGDKSRIIFAPNTIVDDKNQIYNGKVLVSAYYLDPNDPKISDKMPGGLMADDAKGNTVVLGTLGMMAVELRDEAGNELNIKSGTTATLEFPAVTSYKPSDIPLWSFNENKGWWKEEGKATLQGDRYVAKVSHFSFWNCDAPFPLIEICGKIKDEEGKPVYPVMIEVKAEGLGTSFGWTNEKGEFCGKMPKGKKLTISVYSMFCDKLLLKTVEVGPFDNNTVLNDIIIKKQKEYRIKGSLLCNGVKPSEGIVIITIDNQKLLYRTNENGVFDIDLSSLICDQVKKVEIFGFDNISGATSNTKEFLEQPNTEVILNLCEVSCDFEATLKYNCKDKLSAEISGGSGNFKYSWSTGEIVKDILIKEDTISEGKTYCVTITDLAANCTKTFCKLVKPIQVFIRNSCDEQKLYGQHFGGDDPVAYLWSNGSKDQNIFPTVSGNYCLTVTDKNGCSASACEFFDNDPFFVDMQPTCSESQLSFSSSPFDYGYFNGNGTNLFGNLTFPIEMSVFESGFNFTISLFRNKCSISKQIKIPQLINGLEATVKNTTCATCNDGKINYNIVANATCFECTVGNVKIFNINQINTDLTTENNADQLAKGEYYVVVTDKNTGCYIAFKKVKVN